MADLGQTPSTSPPLLTLTGLTGLMVLFNEKQVFAIKTQLFCAFGVSKNRFLGAGCPSGWSGQAPPRPLTEVRPLHKKLLSIRLTI